jgi:hypothetical protein
MWIDSNSLFSELESNKEQNKNIINSTIQPINIIDRDSSISDLRKLLKSIQDKQSYKKLA